MNFSHLTQAIHLRTSPNHRLHTATLVPVTNIGSFAQLKSHLHHRLTPDPQLYRIPAQSHILYLCISKYLRIDFRMFALFKNAYKQSYNIAPPPLTEANLPSQLGRVVIITGGYAGVGQELSRIIYQHDGTVYIAGRSAEKAEKSITDTKALFPESKGKIEFLKVDLADLETVRGAVEEFQGKESKLDVLVNNAGVMVPPVGSRSVQGHELQMGMCD